LGFSRQKAQHGAGTLLSLNTTKNWSLNNSIATIQTEIITLQSSLLSVSIEVAMCGLLKVIGVLACLLLIPATPQAQQDRRTGSGAKCKNPKGLEGDIYNDYCTQFTCTKAKGKSGIWVDRPNIDDCCFNQGTGYQMGDVINVTVTNCTETSLVCERREGLATVVACSACTCFQEILTKLDENGHKIDEIKTEVIENGENIQQIIGDIQEGECEGECEDTECQLENTYLKGRESSLVGGGGVQDIQSWCECQQLCAGYSECESFVWNYLNNSVCYLLSDVPDETGTYQGASSGIKTCWAPSNSCPTGWTRFQGACYKLYKEIKTWADARAYCLTQQADLVSVHSEEEENFVKQLVDGYDTIWLGGMDIKFDGQWRWSDGTPWDYQNWQPGKPGVSEGCVEFGSKGWNDVHGLFTGHTKGFICKN